MGKLRAFTVRKFGLLLTTVMVVAATGGQKDPVGKNLIHNGQEIRKQTTHRFNQCPVRRLAYPAHV